MRAYLKFNQRLSQPLAERKRLVKAKVLDVYHSRSYMECYHFCQQCKDYFETVEAIGANQFLYAALFLYGNISVRQTQFKRCHQGKDVASITWPEFKAFLQKNLGKSKLFVNSIWKKIKKDFQYQPKEVYNQVFHFKYLLSILIEFDPAVAPIKSTIVKDFEKGLKPSIKKPR